MIRVALLAVYSLMAVHTAAVPLGILPNGALVNTNSNLTMNASDCDACVCAMFASVDNSNILALNCFLNYSNGVVCQLFTNATYLQCNSTEIEINLNSTLYFRQLPIRNQFNGTTVASDAAPSTTSTAGTTICSTPSSTTAVTSSPLPSQCFNYTSITDGTRNAASTESGGCDNTTFATTPMWVRFSSAAGTMLANCMIEPFHCGANSPGWYTGLYPATAGGTTNGTVCYTWAGGSTCFYSNQISVTNCNNYHVFALTQPTTCNLRYCTI